MPEKCPHKYITWYDHDFIGDEIHLEGHCNNCGLDFVELYDISGYFEIGNSETVVPELRFLQPTVDPKRTCRNCRYCVGHVAKIGDAIALCIEGGSADELGNIDEPLDEYQCNAWKERK